MTFLVIKTENVTNSDYAVQNRPWYCVNHTAKNARDSFLRLNQAVSFSKLTSVASHYTIHSWNFTSEQNFEKMPVLDPFNANIMKYMDKMKTVIACQGEHYTTYHGGILSLVRTGVLLIYYFTVLSNVKGKWQYIFLFSRLKEHLKPYRKLFYRFFISCLLLQIF
jgi:hypothetical protein